MSEDSMLEIIRRIKERRTELGYSFQELADLTGMSKSTLQRYETGAIKNIPLDRLKDLARALRVTPEWIMGWDTPSHSSRQSYYLDPEAAAFAQEIFEDPELRILFDATRKVSKEDLQLVVDMVKRLKKEDE